MSVRVIKTFAVKTAERAVEEPSNDWPPPKRSEARSGNGLIRSLQENSNARKIESTAEGSRCRIVGKARRQPKSKLKGASREMVDSMSEKQLDDMASTKCKGKPQHVSH